MSCGSTRILALIAALLMAATGAASEPRSTFSERLDLVQVEVALVVTDSKGRPVTDLDRADLELYHDGARQEILYLEKPSRDGVIVPDGVAGDRSRQLVIYVDNLRIWPKRRNTLLRRLSRFIEQRLTRGDRVSVAAFDGSVELLVVDSRDVGDIQASLDALASRPTGMPRVASESRQLRQALAEGVDAAVLQPRMERHAKRLHLDAVRSLAGLSATIQAVVRPSRLASILYLSDGLPAWPGDELSAGSAGDAESRMVIRRKKRGEDGATDQGVPTPNVQYLVSLPRFRPGPSRTPEIGGTAKYLAPLIRVANAHGVAFHPVRPSAFLHPQVHGSQARGGTRADHIGPLRRLAESTGGDFLPYGGFEAALDRLSRRLDSVYTLGFQVSPSDDQVTHALEIQVARKGLKAHHRRAYSLDGDYSSRSTDAGSSPEARRAGR